MQYQHHAGTCPTNRHLLCVAIAARNGTNSKGEWPLTLHIAAPAVLSILPTLSMLLLLLLHLPGLPQLSLCVLSCTTGRPASSLCSPLGLSGDLSPQSSASHSPLKDLQYRALGAAGMSSCKRLNKMDFSLSYANDSHNTGKITLALHFAVGSSITRKFYSQSHFKI